MVAQLFVELSMEAPVTLLMHWSWLFLFLTLSFLSLRYGKITLETLKIVSIDDYLKRRLRFVSVFRTKLFEYWVCSSNLKAGEPRKTNARFFYAATAFSLEGSLWSQLQDGFGICQWEVSCGVSCKRKFIFICHNDEATPNRPKAWPCSESKV